jgi:hypothetical protein
MKFMQILILILFLSKLFYRSEINVKSATATMVVWLQNDSGYNMYKPTDAAVDAFLESYRPGKDKNSDGNSSTVDSSALSTNNS